MIQLKERSNKHGNQGEVEKLNKGTHELIQTKKSQNNDTNRTYK